MYPVNVLALVSTHVPESCLNKLVQPETTVLSVLRSVLVPPKKKLPLDGVENCPSRMSAPLPDESILPPFPVILKPRSVVSPAPTYFNVPELKTIFEAELEAAPMLPATPPLLI